MKIDNLKLLPKIALLLSFSAFSIFASDQEREEKPRFTNSSQAESKQDSRTTEENSFSTNSFMSPPRNIRQGLSDSVARENQRIREENKQLKESLRTLIKLATNKKLVRPSLADFLNEAFKKQTTNKYRDAVKDTCRVQLPLYHEKQVSSVVQESSKKIVKVFQSNPTHISSMGGATIQYYDFNLLESVSDKELNDLEKSFRDLSTAILPAEEMKGGLFEFLKNMIPTLEINREEENLESLPRYAEVEGILPQDVVGIFDRYVIGNAVGDGDCFFHAAFTRAGQTESAIRDQALNIRRRALDNIQRSQEYQNLMRGEILGHFRVIMGRDKVIEEELKTVPENIRNMLDENFTHEITRQSFVDRGRPLPANLQNQILHNDATILQTIDPAFIASYAERYVNYNQDNPNDFYIEIPVFGRENAYQTSGIGEVIARIENLTVNYFTWNQRTHSLNYSGRLGNNGRVVNVLIHGDHFYPLYNNAEGDPRLNDFVQTLYNSLFNQPWK